MILDKEYFKNNDTILLARDLIGKILVRRLDSGTVLKSIITETEAYHGENDNACHARFGKTKRNEVMYQQGGVWYIYLCYGIHWLLNIVTGEADFPAAVLIRGISAIKGPGRVTKYLQIDNSLCAKPAIPLTGLWIEDEGNIVKEVETAPRIGVSYAGTHALYPWRFILKDSI